MSRLGRVLVSVLIALLAVGTSVLTPSGGVCAEVSNHSCGSGCTAEVADLRDADASLPQTGNGMVCASSTAAGDTGALSVGSGDRLLEYAQPRAAGDHWAIIVGVSLYQSVDIPDLTYPDDDALALHGILSPVWGDSHVKLLLNSQATKSGIQNAISTWLDPLEDADDTVVFYFSGHGEQANFDQSPSDETDGKDETICPYDTSVYSWAYDIFDDELSTWLGGLEAGKQVVILDSCRSGGFIDKYGGFKLVGTVPDAGDGLTKDLSKSGRVILSGCAENESSWEYLALGHGVFTYYVLNALSHLKVADGDANNEVSAEEIFDYAQPRTTSYQPAQHPHVYDGYTGELALFDLATLSIDASPRVPSVTLDGEAYSAANLPVSEKLIIGSSHSLSVSAGVDTGIPQSRYGFTAWNDGATSNTRIVTVTGSASYVANYTIQYYLTVQSVHGNPQGDGWHDQDSTVQFSVDSVDDEGTGTRYVFAGWSGDSSATDNVSTVVLDSPRTVTAAWRTQHRLTVESERGNPQGDGWYDEGSTAQFSVDALVDQGGGVRYAFAGWSGDSSATDSTSSMIMDSPKTATAVWGVECKLTISSDPSGITSLKEETWGGQGSGVSTGRAELVVQGSTGVRYMFSSWSVDGKVVTGNPVSVQMDAPHAVVARYTVQYELTVLPDRGDPKGSGWYDAGSEADISVTSPLGSLVRQVFVKWNGGASATQRETTVPMDGPKTVEAEWRTDYTYLYVLVGCLAVLTVLVGTGIILFTRKRSPRDST